MEALLSQLEMWLWEVRELVAGALCVIVILVCSKQMKKSLGVINEED